MKCSNCGADVPAVNVQYSWKQLLFIVPLLLVGFWPLAQLTILRGDVTKDLVIRQVGKKLSFQDSPRGKLVVTGLIKKILANVIGRVLRSRQNFSMNRACFSTRHQNIYEVISWAKLKNILKWKFVVQEMR